MRNRRMYLNRLFHHAHFEVQPDGIEQGGGAAGNTKGGETAEGSQGAGSGAESEMKTPSFDDFMKAPGNQAEFDRRVQKALNTAREKWEAATNDKLSEAEKLAKMNKDEKRDYLAQKKETELDEREKAIARRELMAEAKNTLTGKGLPLELADTLDYTNADTCGKSIESVEKAFQKVVEAAVSERLKGGAPGKKAPDTPAEKALDDQIYQYMKG